MSRIEFWKIFQVNPDGSLQVLRKISLGGFVLVPGQRIQRGVTFSGFNIFDYTGRDLEIEKKDDTEVITGVY